MSLCTLHSESAHPHPGRVAGSHRYGVDHLRRVRELGLKTRTMVLAVGVGYLERRLLLRTRDRGTITRWVSVQCQGMSGEYYDGRINR